MTDEMRQFVLDNKAKTTEELCEMHKDQAAVVGQAEIAAADARTRLEILMAELTSRGDGAEHLHPHAHGAGKSYN
jgi:hypothetical protein